MALTDPELDLLAEILEEDPTADVYLQVGEELVRRGEWARAIHILAPGLEANSDEPRGWGLLCRSRLEVGDYTGALEAVDQTDADPQAHPDVARVRVLALERSGRTDECRDAVDAFLAVHSSDVVVEAVLERLDNPQPASPSVLRGTDPFVTLARIQSFEAIGRPDRALRLARRLLHHNPNSDQARLAVQRLATSDQRQMTEDLSEEISAPEMSPPTLDMPAPQLIAMIADEEATDPRTLADAIQAYGRGEAENPLPSDFGGETSTVTERMTPTPGGSRRRRRSLLNKKRPS